MIGEIRVHLTVKDKCVIYSVGPLHIGTSLGGREMTPGEFKQFREALQRLLDIRVREMAQRIVLDSNYVREFLIREECKRTSRA